MVFVEKMRVCVSPGINPRQAQQRSECAPPLREPPFVALSARRADLLEWKEGRVHQEDASEEGRKPDLRTEAETPRLYALQRVNQTKLVERARSARAARRLADQSLQW